jgi:hypothetical protein
MVSLGHAVMRQGMTRGVDGQSIRPRSMLFVHGRRLQTRPRGRGEQKRRSRDRGMHGVKSVERDTI